MNTTALGSMHRSYGVLHLGHFQFVRTGLPGRSFLGRNSPIQSLGYTPVLLISSKWHLNLSDYAISTEEFEAADLKNGAIHLRTDRSGRPVLTNVPTLVTQITSAEENPDCYWC